MAGSLSQRRGDRTAAISAAGAAAGLARRSAAAARPGLAPRPAPPPLPLRGVATAPTGQPGHERGASRSSCSAPLRAARGDPGPRRRTGTRPVTPRGPGAAAPPPLLPPPPPRPPPPPAAAAAAARAAARPSRERGADPPRQRLGSSAARRGSIPRAWWAPSAAAAVRRGSWPLQGWAAPSPARQPGTSYVCEPSTSAGGVYGGRGGAFAGSRCERSPPRGGRLKPAPPLRGRSERAAVSPHPLRPRPAPLPQPYLAGEPPSAPRLGPYAAPPAPHRRTKREATPTRGPQSPASGRRGGQGAAARPAPKPRRSPPSLGPGQRSAQPARPAPGTFGGNAASLRKRLHGAHNNRNGVSAPFPHTTVVKAGLCAPHRSALLLLALTVLVFYSPLSIAMVLSTLSSCPCPEKLLAKFTPTPRPEYCST